MQNALVNGKIRQASCWPTTIAWPPKQQQLADATVSSSGGSSDATATAGSAKYLDPGIPIEQRIDAVPH